MYVVERRNVLDNSVSVEDMAEDTAEIMKNCGITKAYLYGVSQGGVMVQLIAAKHPELVEKAVIVSSTSRINDMVRNVMSSFIEKLHAGQLQALGEDFAEKLYAPETIKQFPSLKTIDPNIPEINLKNFEIMARDCMYGETDAILDRIKCPVLVIGGKLDRVYGEEENIYLAERLNCRYISYEKFGHAVYDECPEVLKEVYRFFIS